MSRLRTTAAYAALTLLSGAPALAEEPTVTTHETISIGEIHVGCDADDATLTRRIWEQLDALAKSAKERGVVGVGEVEKDEPMPPEMLEQLRRDRFHVLSSLPDDVPSGTHVHIFCKKRLAPRAPNS